jgi:hypothetical protein
MQDIVIKEKNKSETKHKIAERLKSRSSARFESRHPESVMRHGSVPLFPRLYLQAVQLDTASRLVLQAPVIDSSHRFRWNAHTEKAQEG